MYGDATVMAARVRDLRDQGVDLRLTADRLVARAEQVTWAGRAADAMRERIRERATHLRQVADSHDLAADALTRHLGEIEQLTDAIASIESKTAALRADARDRMARGVTGSDDAALVGFVAPPPGHRDWLTVELPGL